MKRVLVGSALTLWMLVGRPLPVHAGGIQLKSRCTLDDPTGTKLTAARDMVNQQCPCATATSHGAYVDCARAVAAQEVAARNLPQSCQRAVKVCASKSTCGRSLNSVTCCISDRFGHPGCRITSSSEMCTQMRGTPNNHTPAPCVSCCDACPNPGAGPSCPASASGAFTASGSGPLNFTLVIEKPGSRAT